LLECGTVKFNAKLGVVPEVMPEALHKGSLFARIFRPLLAIKVSVWERWQMTLN
jgi:hypothetical protein